MIEIDEGEEDGLDPIGIAHVGEGKKVKEVADRAWPDEASACRLADPVGPRAPKRAAKPAGEGSEAVAVHGEPGGELGGLSAGVYVVIGRADHVEGVVVHAGCSVADAAGVRQWASGDPGDVWHLGGHPVRQDNKVLPPLRRRSQWGGGGGEAGPGCSGSCIR